MAEIGLALDAFAHEACSLGVSHRPFVESVDLELQPVVAELVEEMPLKEPGGLVGNAPAAKGGMNCEPLQVCDLRPTVPELEAQHTRALAVHLDHEPPVFPRLGFRAFDLAQEAVAV